MIFQNMLKNTDNGLATTIMAGYHKMRVTEPFIRIKNDNKKGYLDAEENDIIDITSSCTKNHRGVVQKGKSHSIVCADGGGEV